MDYATQQRDPTKHAIGVGFVILMHVLLVYALLTGLGRAIVDVVKKPLSATIIEQIKPPPPPPPAAEEDHRGAEGCAAARDVRSAAGHSGRPSSTRRRRSRRRRPRRRSSRM